MPLPTIADQCYIQRFFADELSKTEDEEDSPTEQVEESNSPTEQDEESELKETSGKIF